MTEVPLAQPAQVCTYVLHTPYNVTTCCGTLHHHQQVMDDFLRNFFVKMGLSRTCEAFEAEWYELKATGRLEGDSAVPDVYIRNAVSERNGGVMLGTPGALPSLETEQLYQANHENYFFPNQTVARSNCRLSPAVATWLVLDMHCSPHFVFCQELEEEVAGLKKELGDARAIAAKVMTGCKCRCQHPMRGMQHAPLAWCPQSSLGTHGRTSCQLLAAAHLYAC